MKLEEYLETLQSKYEAYFDIYLNCSILGRQLDIFACSHVKCEQFCKCISKSITKRATLSAFETNEYCLVEGHFAKIYAPQVQDFTTFLVKAASEMVKPHEQHMSSMITGILVSEQGFAPEAIHIGRKFKHDRSFWLGLRGWYSIRLLLVDLSLGQVYASPKGKEVMKHYQPKPVPQNVLSPQY
jgi:hypothetical protein